MNNYEYIVASLPVLHQDDRKEQNLDVDAIVEEIREQCSQRDNALIDMLLDGYDPQKLDEDFYRKAIAEKNGFIRGWFQYDLNVRNAKVEYLNKALGREDGTDMMLIGDEDFEGKAEVQAVLNTNDILARERGLDDLMWNCIEELTLMHDFDIEVILGFIAKLKIIDRWLRLDPETGRALFRKLVEEIRNTK